jgi:hypothetical protein
VPETRSAGIVGESQGGGESPVELVLANVNALLSRLTALGAAVVRPPESTRAATIDPLQMPHSTWEGADEEEQVALDLELTGALSEWAKGFFAGSKADWVAVAGSVAYPLVVASGSHDEWPSDEQVQAWVDERGGKTVCLLDRPPVIFFAAAVAATHSWRGLGQRRPALSLSLTQSADDQPLTLTGILDTGTAETHLDVGVIGARVRPEMMGRWLPHPIGPQIVQRLRCNLTVQVDFGVGAPLRRTLSPIYLCRGLRNLLYTLEGEVLDGLFGVDLLTAPNGGGVEVLLDGRTRTTRVLAVHAGA